MEKTAQNNLNNVKKILRGKRKKDIALKFGCGVGHITSILNGNRQNDEILLYCIEEAEKLSIENKKRRTTIKKKASKIKI